MCNEIVECNGTKMSWLILAIAATLFAALFWPQQASAQFKTEWEISEPAAAGGAKPHEQGSIFATVNSGITVYAFVYQSEGYPLPDNRTPTAQLKWKPLGSDGPYQLIATSPVPSLGARRNAKIQFSITTGGPGGRLYKVCLTGLLDNNARAVPDKCGLERVMYVRRPSQDIWTVSRVSVFPQLTGDANTVPEYEWFSIEFTVNNIAPEFGRNNPDGFSLRSRNSGETGGGQVRGIGTYQELRQTVDGREVFRTQYGELRRGAYEIRACVHDARIVPDAPIDWVCGPWTTITSVAPTQPVAPKQPQATDRNGDGKSCSGGRLKTSGGRCVCPKGKKWNAKAGAGRCISPTAKICPDRKRRKADGTCCPAGHLARLNRCVKRKVAKTGQKQDNRLRCIGGQVRGKLCWCGIGKFPRKVRGNTFKCR